jgi:hypothetical protein
LRKKRLYITVMNARNHRRRRTSKPYEIVGAGQLTATVWKTGDAACGWKYRFNVYRQSQESGVVSQLYRPADVKDLVKLCQVLAIALVDDGCLTAGERRVLVKLTAQLDSVTRSGE